MIAALKGIGSVSEKSQAERTLDKLPANKDATYPRREIPPDRQDFNAHLPDDKKLVVWFEPSVKYQLIETYGLNCFTETEDGWLRLEIGYTNRDYTISWLLGFGHKAKVIEPIDMADEIKQIAEKMFQNHK